MRTASKELAPPTSEDLVNNLNELGRRLGPVELRPVRSLKKYAGNPRKHPERQLALEASIRQFGLTIPILIGEDGEIIAGEARLDAATRLGRYCQTKCTAVSRSG